MKILDSDVGIMARIGLMFFLCGISWFTVIGGSISQMNPSGLSAQEEMRLREVESSITGDRVITERRFSVLETKMDAVQDAQKESNTIRWIELLMLSGLMGERGIQLIKSRKGQERTP